MTAIHINKSVMRAHVYMYKCTYIYECIRKYTYTRQTRLGV